MTVHNGDDTARLAILDHHAALSRELDARVEHVLTAVRNGTDPDSVRHALTAFLVGKLMPHAVAEEHTLYPAAARDRYAELLVSTMIDEHRGLSDRVARLAEVTDPITLATTAAELRALFEAHVHKENEYLLPALVAAHVDVAGLLHDTHEQLAGDRG
jgi:iron-sulfur cluster repair protein YtfE (RIC family)